VKIFADWSLQTLSLTLHLHSPHIYTHNTHHTTPLQLNGHAIFKPQEPPPLTLTPRMSLASSPKHATGERGLPPYEPTTSRKTGGSYADMYLTKLQRGTAASIAANPVHVPGYSRKGSLKGTNDSTLFIQRTPLPPHANTAAIPPPITAKRHCSLPEGVLPHSSISQSMGGHWQEVQASEGHQLPLVYGPHVDVMGPGMSVSWPRSRMSVPVEVPRGSQQISANASAMVRGGKMCVEFMCSCHFAEWGWIMCVIGIGKRVHC